MRDHIELSGNRKGEVAECPCPSPQVAQDDRFVCHYVRAKTARRTDAGLSSLQLKEENLQHSRARSRTRATPVSAGGPLQVSRRW